MRKIHKKCAAMLFFLFVCILPACGNKNQSITESENAAGTKENIQESGEVEAVEDSESFRSQNDSTGQIADQSFESEFDGWGTVTFAPFEPEEMTEQGGVYYYRDVRFSFLKEGDAVYTFPGYYNVSGEDNTMSGQEFGQVLSVAFKDYNEDGRKDILLILEYAGVQGIDIGQSWQEVRLYTQVEGGKEFQGDKLLTEFLAKNGYTENMEQVYQGIAEYARGYEVATKLSTWEVERFAKHVKKLILQGDYESLADDIAYPIEIDGVSYGDKTAFLGADFVKQPNPDFVAEIEEEPGEMLFCNWKGIMMGSGAVWFGETLNQDGSSCLKVIGMNKISAKPSQPQTLSETERLINERAPYYFASSFYEEIIDYWENVREVRDVSNVMEPLYETDEKYLTEEELADEPPMVIHLAKNEIYARHGYIFEDPDLYNYFMGCIWYTPLVKAENFSAEVFNEYEVENLRLLSELDTY